MLLGQTYDPSHFPIIPVMMRSATADTSTTTPLPVAQGQDDTDTMTVAAQGIDLTPDIFQDTSDPPASSGDSAPPKLFRYQTCHDTFFTEVSLLAHHNKFPQHADRTTTEVANPGTRQPGTAKPPKVTIKHMLACQPEGPYPEPAKMYRCPICHDMIGRKALVNHFRKSHDAAKPDGFPFDPRVDMHPGHLAYKH